MSVTSRGARRRGFSMSALAKSLWLCAVALAAAMLRRRRPPRTPLPPGLIAPARRRFRTSLGRSSCQPRPPRAAKLVALAARPGPAAGDGLRAVRRADAAGDPAAGRWIARSAPPLPRPPPRSRRLSTALEAALAALVAESVKTQPDRRRRLARGARGDRGVLRGARFRAGLGHGTGPDARRAIRRSPDSPARTRTGSISRAFALPKVPLPTCRRSASPRPKPSFRAAVVAYAMQASGARLVPTRDFAADRRAAERRRSGRRRWPRSPSPPTLAPRSRPSIRSKRAISSCATN